MTLQTPRKLDGVRSARFSAIRAARTSGALRPILGKR